MLLVATVSRLFVPRFFMLVSAALQLYHLGLQYSSVTDQCLDVLANSFYVVVYNYSISELYKHGHHQSRFDFEKLARQWIATLVILVFISVYQPVRGVNILSGAAEFVAVVWCVPRMLTETNIGRRFDQMKFEPSVVAVRRFIEACLVQAVDYTSLSDCELYIERGRLIQRRKVD